MKSINLQLYSLGFENRTPMPETFQTIATMGYTGVEFFASLYGDLSPADMKKALVDAGLKAISSHVSLQAMERDIPYMAEIGASMVVCPMADFADEAETLELAGQLNRYGRLASEHGMKLGYHNHTQEFYQVNGKMLLDILLENTDPALVGLELDCGWCSCAGLDPVSYIQKHAGRVLGIHVKENNGVLGADKPHSMHVAKESPVIFNADGTISFKPEFARIKQIKDQLNVATGSGIVDWKAVRDAADAQGEVHYFVEREANYDPSKDRLTCLAEDARWVLENLVNG